MRRTSVFIASLILVVGAGVGCKKKPPTATPTPPPNSNAPRFPGAVTPPPSAGTASATVTTPPDPAMAAIAVPPDPTVTSDPFLSMTPEEINKNSPLGPVFFGYDSEEVDDAARVALTENAKVLKSHPAWVITIEGHSDERGTAEYNLALGDRRALAVKNYLLSLGIAADRLRTVSYGKEFPFDPAHTEPAWAQNRRAHFVVTTAR